METYPTLTINPMEPVKIPIFRGTVVDLGNGIIESNNPDSSVWWDFDFDMTNEVTILAN